MRPSVKAIALCCLIATPALGQAPQLDADIRVGDQWTYQQKDEITGSVVSTVAIVVTDISEKEISTRVTVRGGRPTLRIYDRQWNRIDDWPWKFSPNDGGGVLHPLSAGKEWRSESDAINSQVNSVLHSAI